MRIFEGFFFFTRSLGIVHKGRPALTSRKLCFSAASGHKCLEICHIAGYSRRQRQTSFMDGPLVCGGIMHCGVIFLKYCNPCSYWRLCKIKMIVTILLNWYANILVWKVYFSHFIFQYLLPICMFIIKWTQKYSL